MAGLLIVDTELQDNALVYCKVKDSEEEGLITQKALLIVTDVPALEASHGLALILTVTIAVRIIMCLVSIKESQRDKNQIAGEQPDDELDRAIGLGGEDEPNESQENNQLQTTNSTLQLGYAWAGRAKRRAQYCINGSVVPVVTKTSDVLTKKQLR